MPASVSVGVGPGAQQCVSPVWVPPVIAGATFSYIAHQTTTVRDGSGNVSQWLDVSGNGNHSQTQATSGSRPLYVESGAIGGRPSLLFDGVDDFLLSPAIALAQPTTTLIVFGRVGAQGTKFVSDSLTAQTRQTLFTLSATQLDTYWEDPTARQIVATNTVPLGGQIVVSQFNVNSSFMRINAVQTNAAYAASAAPAASGMTIGGRFSQTALWSGPIAAVLQYIGALSGANISALEASANAYYRVY